MKKKELYAAPETEVLELKLEAHVLLGSNTEGGGEDLDGGWGGGY